MGIGSARYNSAFTAPSSGRHEIDSLLGGRFWSSDGIPGKALKLTYSFVSPEYESVTTDWEEGTALDPSFITDGLKSSIAGVFRHLADFTSLSFTEQKGGGEPGRILIGASKTLSGTSLLGVLAHASYPSEDDFAGSVWFDAWYSYPKMDAPVGSELRSIAMHEIGHALGLKHPHDNDHGFPVTRTYDSSAYSLMSYKSKIGDDGSGGFKSTPLTYMLNDMAALQYLYGKNMTTRTGDNRYDFAGKTYVYETIWDAGGNDTVSWSGRDTSANIDLTPGTLSFFGGVDTKSDPAAWDKGSGILGIAYGTDIENAEGGNGHDILRGNDGNNRLQGGRGNDLLEGRGGRDTIDGGDGIDTVSYAFLDRPVSITLNGAVSSVVKVDGQGKDTLRNIENVQGGAGADHLTGDSGDNVLEGGDGADHIDGGAGRDRLYGDGGADHLTGGAGADVFAWRNVSDSGPGIIVRDTIHDFSPADDDRLDFSELDANAILQGHQALTFSGQTPRSFSLWYKSDASGLTVFADTSGDTKEDFSVRLKDVKSLSAENLILDTAGVVSLVDANGVLVTSALGGPVQVSLEGGQTGYGAVPVPVRVNGVEVGRVQGVKDIVGSSHDDHLTGDAQDNRFTGYGGHDVLDGKEGQDTAVFGDAIGPISVTLDRARPVTVTINGVAAATISNIENVMGGFAADTLVGDSADNVLSGAMGNDTLSGAGGNDRLHGDMGADRLTGGLGADVFWYRSAYESGPLPQERDTITDFSSVHGDRIDLSALVVFDASGAYRPLTFGGTEARAGGVWYVKDSLGVVVYADVSGDAAADFSVRLNNVHSLLAKDFILDPVVPLSQGIEDAVYTMDFATDPVNITLDSGTPSPVLVNGVRVAEIMGYSGLSGGAADDHLTGNDANNRFRSSGGRDVIDGRGGRDSMNYASEQGPVVVTLADGAEDAVVRVNGLEKDTLRNIEAIVGGTGHDRITGNASDNVLLGNEGDDVLSGGAGHDALYGDKGDDVLDGGAGNDFLGGGEGTDSVSYAGYTLPLEIVLRGDSWGYASIGTVEKDYLHSIEIVTAGSGDDTLAVEFQYATLSGGPGADTFVYSGRFGFNDPSAIFGTPSAEQVIQDFNAAEGDRIDLAHLDRGLLVYDFGVKGPAKNAVWSTQDGKDLVLRVDETGDAVSDFTIRLKNCSSVSASDFVLSQRPDIGPDTVLEAVKNSGEYAYFDLFNSEVHFGGQKYTLPPSSTITGGTWQNYILAPLPSATPLNIDGGDGKDTVSLVMTSVPVSLTLNGSNWSKIFYTGLSSAAQVRNIENIVAGNYGDTLTGDNNDNTFTPGFGADTIDGGPGSDTVDYRYSPGSIKVTLAGNQWAMVSTGSGQQPDRIRNIENIDGGRADDVLVGDAMNNTFVGHGGNDEIDGGAGQDTVDYSYSSKGVEVTLAGSAWANVSIDGQVEDRIRNIENVTGSSMNDRIFGDEGNNILRGGDGNDWFKAGLGHDTLDGGFGVDIADYTDRSESIVVTLDGENPARVFFNGVAQDTLINIESIWGGSGNDRLVGDYSDNSLSGGRGADILGGGGGADTFLYFLISDSGADEVSRDTIMDFSSKDGDRIKLASIDANKALPGDQNFVFHGQNAGANGVWYQPDGSGNTLLFADDNGDAQADFSIFLLGVSSLSQTDLVLS
ncbi:matrixin family metalloprotease [Haematospirillum jordaniae]|uniref:M10 family metallopeptidase C-terminal domain-containing protein n=1 Tax=Haematospirillum jordaniae TaxID=1549855 RepID=UPI001432EE13|nr:M10 family metallopeptidase C-terminal domain-containing protein [Haematospirillum jordaniae]NKD85414.1 matrixin family metalloprotease [Haematospirillum jordaniae]